jgi:TonB family protein
MSFAKAFVLAALLTIATGAACGQAPQPMRVSAGVMAGNLLTRVVPVYPPEAKADGISGTVVLHAIIGTDGTIQNLTVISGTPVLATAAVDAVQQWTYKPYLLNGNPVAVDTLININFNLAGPASAPPTSSTPVPDTMANVHTETVKIIGGQGDPPPVPDSSGAISVLNAPNTTSTVPPVYPPIARAAHVTGTVVLQALISKDGNVRALSVISGPPMLYGAAIDAVRQWHYKPYLLNGEPVEVDTHVTVNFSLSDEPPHR